MPKPDWITDSEWATLRQICDRYGVPPELVAAIGWHETHWGRLGAGRQGYYLGVGVPSQGPVLKSAAGLERQLLTRMYYTGRPWIESLAMYPVTYEGVLRFAREVHRPDNPEAWAESVWSIYSGMLGGAEREAGAAGGTPLPEGRAPWLVPPERTYFTRPLDPNREDYGSEINPAEFTAEQLLDMTCYSEVMYNCRGRFLQAFPTYLMMFIDEGEWVGGRKLWDNFYFYHSMLSLQVVKDRSSPMDVAFIELTNVYGALNHYTLPQGVQSVHWIQKLFPAITRQSLELRKKLFTDLMIRPGARVHIRMGYGSLASRLPVVFNGVIVEVNTEDAATFVAQGDGHELLNEIVQFSPKTSTSSTNIGKEPLDIIRHIMCDRGFLFHLNVPMLSRLIAKVTGDVVSQEEVGKQYVFGASNTFGIEHFGTVRRDQTPLVVGKGIKTWDVLMNVYRTNVPIGRLNRAWRDRLAGVQEDREEDKSWVAALWEEGREKLQELVQKVFKERNVGIWLGGKTPWDIFRTLARTTTGYVVSVFPFQFRSSLFFGLPWWPVCIKYRRRASGAPRTYKNPLPYNEEALQRTRELYEDMLSSGM